MLTLTFHLLSGPVGSECWSSTPLWSISLLCPCLNSSICTVSASPLCRGLGVRASPTSPGRDSLCAHKNLEATCPWLYPALSLGGQATAWECSPGRSLCLTKSSACRRLWQFAHPRPLSLLQRGLAPRSKGKARAGLRPGQWLPLPSGLWRRVAEPDLVEVSVGSLSEGGEGCQVDPRRHDFLLFTGRAGHGASGVT